MNLYSIKVFPLMLSWVRIALRQIMLYIIWDMAILCGESNLLRRPKATKWRSSWDIYCSPNQVHMWTNWRFPRVHSWCADQWVISVRAGECDMQKQWVNNCFIHKKKYEEQQNMLNSKVEASSCPNLIKT